MAINRHIEHIKSKIVNEGAPKLPEAADLHHGEIAINYAKGYETISIKNESGDVVTFKSDDYLINSRLSAVTADTHTHSNKTALDSITGNVGTMAYQNASSYSSATEVSNALNAKANTATTLAGYNISDAKIVNGTITLGSNTITPLTSVTIPVTSVTTSSTNGNISVNGTNVEVHGLGGAAYLSTGTTAGTVATGNHTHSNYVGTATTVTGGTGLSGGGALSSNVTINLAMPTVHSGSSMPSVTSSEPIVYVMVKTSSTSLNNVICPITLNEGQQCNVIYYTTAACTISVSTTNNISTDNTQINITTKAGGYAEINYIKLGGYVFVRGV